jgi:uncharacterized membrane protein
LPPWLGWVVLVLAAAGGIALAFQFYRHTLRALTWRQRLIFATLRCGFLISLLLCLAGPARVERVFDAGQDARPLAVIVDRSPSMNVADSAGTTRLSYALRVWKKVEANAIHSFPSLSYFHFSDSLVSAPDLEGAMTAPDSGGETHLYNSLDQALKDAPAGGYGGVACLTDGLDTTDDTPEELTSRALQSHSPLYFAVGQNQQAAHENLMIRELAVPGRALRKSHFTATVMIEAHTTKERDVPVSLSVENQPVAQTTLHLHAGNNLIPWPVQLDTAEPGLLHLQARLGDGADQETVAAAMPVISSDQIHILFYQGTLDWSFRFIDTALQDDPSFVLTGLFNPSLNLTQTVAPGSAPALSEMPGSADALQPYQIVVLSNVFGNELSKDQQTALLDYVHGGGGLLFLVSDNAMAQTFAGTDLEKVLPVIFEAPPKQPSHDDSVQQFQDMMRSIGGVNPSREGDFASDSEKDDATPLQNFAVPPSAKHSQIASLFTAGGNGTLQSMPQFSTYARVRGVKAGSEVLAVHPQDKTDTNEARALLVTQRYGQGQVTTLLTDALWRWRLSLPSTSHDPEIFWQQLFLALCKHSAGASGLRFAQQPFAATLGQTSAFRLEGVHGKDAPTITAISPGGQSQILAPQPGSQVGSWQFQLMSNEPGTWRVQAQDTSGAMMETLVRVSNASHKAELSGLPPDTEGLRKLAASTGGSLLNDGVPEDWAAARTHSASTLLSKHSHPLWNNWAVLLMGLGFYVTELIWRRRAKLL